MSIGILQLTMHGLLRGRNPRADQPMTSFDLRGPGDCESYPSGVLDAQHICLSLSASAYGADPHLGLWVILPPFFLVPKPDPTGFLQPDSFMIDHGMKAVMILSHRVMVLDQGEKLSKGPRWKFPMTDR